MTFEVNVARLALSHMLSAFAYFLHSDDTIGS